jgi:hypothetical protein
MNWLIARLREGSTWRGLIWLLTVAGITLRPEQVEALIVAGMALAGLLGVFMQDKKDDKPPIELQGRSSGEPPVSGTADSDQPAITDLPVVDRRKSQRVQVAMQSPIEPASRRDTKPGSASGWNDQ